jgi:hypothetical protein
VHNILKISKDPKKNYIETQKKHPTKQRHKIFQKTADNSKIPTPHFRNSINHVPVWCDIGQKDESGKIRITQF